MAIFWNTKKTDEGQSFCFKIKFKRFNFLVNGLSFIHLNVR